MYTAVVVVVFLLARGFYLRLRGIKEQGQNPQPQVSTHPPPSPPRDVQSIPVRTRHRKTRAPEADLPPRRLVGVDVRLMFEGVGIPLGFDPYATEGLAHTQPTRLIGSEEALAKKIRERASGDALWSFLGTGDIQGMLRNTVLFGQAGHISPNLSGVDLSGIPRVIAGIAQVGEELELNPALGMRDGLGLMMQPLGGASSMRHLDTSHVSVKIPPEGVLVAHVHRFADNLEPIPSGLVWGFKPRYEE